LNVNEAMYIITSKTELSERLCVLAEETAEAHFAAEKYWMAIKRDKKSRRILDNEFYRKELLQEIADVLVAMESIFSKEIIMDINRNAQGMEKDKKWKDLRNVRYVLRQILNMTEFLNEAAFKSRRLMVENNPTTWTKSHADGMLVLSSMSLCGFVGRFIRDNECALFEKTKEEKMIRWAKRLTEGVERDGNVQQDPEELLGNG